MNDTVESKRLLVAVNDLAESRDYFQAYTQFSNDPQYLDAWGDLGLEMARLLQNAILSCGLIAYARPFTDSRGGRWSKLPGRFTAGFTKDERRIHNYVLDARRKLIAHSDFEGINIDAAHVEGGSIVMSVRPVPIVMIPGEGDSLSVSLAAERSSTAARNTFEDVKRMLEELEPHERPSSVFMREPRLFDVDARICIVLIGMVDKIDDAIRLELALDRDNTTAGRDG